MREPNEISEDEYLDRIQRDPARWEKAHETADYQRDRAIEDELIDSNGDKYKVINVSGLCRTGLQQRQSQP